MIPARKTFERENRGAWDNDPVIECRRGVAKLGDNAIRSAITGRTLTCEGP